MINIFLDDWRPVPRNFIPVRSVQECVNLLKEREVNILSLDYNLGAFQPTGFELVKWMAENNIYPKQIFMHSANPFGRVRMYNFLKKYKPDHVELYHFPVSLKPY